MIGVGPPDTFIYPRRNRLEMPGTAPELLRSGETTPITLSVVIVVVNMNNVVEAMVSVVFVLVWLGARFRGMLLTYYSVA